MNIFAAEAEDTPLAGPGCCPASTIAVEAAEAHSRGLIAGDTPSPFEAADPQAYVHETADGLSSLDLMVENLRCAACIRTIEGALRSLPGVEQARVNMSTRRLAVAWRGRDVTGLDIVRSVSELGYPVAPFDAERLSEVSETAEKRLLAAMAVSGFAAGNVMLLSVSIWAGAFSDMGDATRDLFHWISALIALPAIAYAGRPFFHSAFAALAKRNLNMDVPISLAVVLAATYSLYATIEGREHAYFDASVTLVFFLLIGRYLDTRARAKSRSTAEHLLALNAAPAIVVDGEGRERALPSDRVRPGMTVLVAVGERIPVDGVVVDGRSDVDTSLITGETVPTSVCNGDRVYAGTLNISAPLSLEVVSAAEGTLLAEIVRLVEAAEQGRAKYVRIAERAARIYAPVVHILAAATFAGWLIAAGGWEMAMMTAVAVLIITCPCALGLAVPVVQVVATGLLLKLGVLVKSKDALERLAKCDVVVFDKTGTLTRGRPELTGLEGHDPEVLRTAAALARHSRHPLSRALVRAVGDAALPTATEIAESAGAGLEGEVEGMRIRLGSRTWVGVSDRDAGDDAAMELWARCGGEKPVRFAFEDVVRDDARATIAALERAGFGIELLSGDRKAAVKDVAGELGIAEYRYGCTPDEKVARLHQLAAEGRHVLMVGDGLNDAPALASGFASMSPSSAADISQTAADLVFQGDRLGPVHFAIKAARFADRLVKQNFALAIGYNVVAVPMAVLGFATPLVAAAAMSSSSLLVTLNALRLRLLREA